MNDRRASSGDRIAGGWLGAVMAVLLGGSASAGPFLVQNGLPCADIVISNNPPRMVTYAASELQNYLFKITGARLAVTTTPGAGSNHIYVGRSAYTDGLGLSDTGLLYGAFRMVSGTNWLALVGHDADYAPWDPYAASWSDIPRMMAEWDALTGRTWSNPTASDYGRYAPLLDLWQPDERGSLNAVHEYLRSLGVRWFMPNELGEVVPSLPTLAIPATNVLVTPDFAARGLYFYYNQFIDCRTSGLTTSNEIQWQLRLGLYPYPGVLGWATAHGTMAVHDRSEVQAAHPEYYALWDGVRMTNYDGGTGSLHGGPGAPCLSSGGLFTQNVEFVRAVFDIYDSPMMGVGPSDGYVKVCECELCAGKATPERGRSGEHSDYVWDYADRVARAVQATHPDRKISCPAYGYYQLPPTNLAVMSSNLVIGWCQWRSEYQDPAAWESYTNQIAAWMAKLPSRQMYRYDYYLHSGRAEYAGVPVYYPHAIARDLSFLKGKSLGEFIEVHRNYPGDGDTWDAMAANHLNVYVTARLYWDADQDVDALLDDYYDTFYGPAAAEMKSFVEYCEGHWATMRGRKPEMDRALELLAEAGAAAGTGIYSQRVALLSEYVKPIRALRDAMVENHYVARNGQTPVYPYTNWATAASNIQDAVDLAWTNTTVWVGPGRYTVPTNAGITDGSANVVTLRKPMTLRSSTGVPATTVIDGEGANRGVMMEFTVTWPDTSTTHRLILDGLAVSNGYARGGGIRLDPGGTTWTGVVQNCLVTGNATVSPDCAGGIYAYSVFRAFGLVISNCVVRNNSGGGIYSRTFDGGTLITRSRVENNTGIGVVLYAGDNTVRNTVIADNSNAGPGGGFYVAYGAHRLENCLIAGNYSGQAGTGGGALYSYSCAPEFYNCTVVSNRAVSSAVAGVYSHWNSTTRLWNCIVHSNYAGAAQANWGGSGVWSATNCCTYPTNGLPGTANIADSPAFADFSGRNYRLSARSRCIGAGANQAWMDGAFDLDGAPRVLPLTVGTVDMGAYEYPLGSSSIFSFR